jgi:hypothetical protein
LVVGGLLAVAARRVTLDRGTGKFRLERMGGGMNKRSRRSDVPTCDSGPGDRPMFVFTEVRDAWAARRGRRGLGAEAVPDSGTRAMRDGDEDGQPRYLPG